VDFRGKTEKIECSLLPKEEANFIFNSIILSTIRFNIFHDENIT